MINDMRSVFGGVMTRRYFTCKAKNPKFGAGETGYAPSSKDQGKDHKNAPPVLSLAQ
jgi:hypothetical protein